MDENLLEYYLYPKRYLNYKERLLKFNNITKGKILDFIAKREKIFKKRDIWEIYTLKRKQWLEKHIIFIDKIIKRDANYYSGITLKEVSFFEVIEIDDFNKFRRIVLSKFGNSSGFWGIDRKEELREKLDNLENEFDNISWGRLFSINYKKKNSENNDLIDFIDCNYIKTNESYFMIRFDISLSEKANSIIEQIIKQKDTGLSFPKYNSYLKILQRKRFYYHESFTYSLKAYNIQNFISDLSTQVKNNVTRHFNGYFHKSKIFKTLPSIHLYEVDSINEFKLDKELKNLYRSTFGKYYSLEDEQIEIHFSDSWDNSDEKIQVFKQKGHGNNETNKSDKSDYDKLENHFLISSLSFPCVFSAILREQVYKLNVLKRKIYDQIKISGHKYILKHFFLLGMNNKYLQLKHQSIQILLTIKRFEDEFSDRNLQLYTDGDISLKDFIAHNVREKEEKNLLSYYIKAFRYQINRLDKKTKSLNEVFKSLEEFNSYKTNFLLQLFSILIAILAFIFAFDKTKNFVLEIIKMITK